MQSGLIETLLTHAHDDFLPAMTSFAKLPDPSLRQRARRIVNQLGLPLLPRMRIYALRGGDPEKIALIAPDLSFFYAVVPKAANSTIKRHLWALQGVMVGDDEAMDLLHKGAGPCKSISDLSASELSRVLKGPGTFRFTFVRNPYARLVSAYKDKILNLYGNRRPIDYGNNLGFAESDKPPFAEFVRRVAKQSDEAADWHWQSQSQCTLSDLVHYDFIGKVENFAADFNHVLQRIGPGAQLVLERSVNRSAKLEKHGGSVESLYTDELAELVFRRFQRDFDLFGYDADSYRGS